MMILFSNEALCMPAKHSKRVGEFIPQFFLVLATGFAARSTAERARLPAHKHVKNLLVFFSFFLVTLLD